MKTDGTTRLRVLLACLAAGLAILVLGSSRYGSSEGLWHRIRSQVGGPMPHPALDRTSLPQPSGTAGPTSAALAEAPAPATPARAAPHTPSPARGDDFPPGAGLLSPDPTRTSQPSVRGEGLPLSQIGDLAGGTRRSPHPTPTAGPSDVDSEPPSRRFQLPATRLSHIWQTWNNCGPATLSMALSYYGLQIGQDQVGAALRPFSDDKNVSPDELAAYARLQGLKAAARVNGDASRVRALLEAGAPVLIETWHEPQPNDGMGHYRLLVGYDDGAGEWIAYDSYDSHGVSRDAPYAGIRLPYDALDPLWAVFNRTYVIVYDDARASAVEQILGAELDDGAMWERSLATARQAVEAQPANACAWFNLASSLTAGGEYAAAAEGFDRARQLGLPWRMLWYQFAPFRAYHEVGRYDEVIALADATLQTARTVEELFFWRGRAQQAAGDFEGARASLQRALELQPNYTEAAAALASLP